jgi:hypothetical protein
MENMTEMNWPFLRPGAKGPAVRLWREVLRKDGFNLAEDGDHFDEPTAIATRDYQARYHLDMDGLVGEQTWGWAAKMHSDLQKEVRDIPAASKSSSAKGATLPPKTAKALTAKRRMALYEREPFGKAEFEESAKYGEDQDSIRFTTGYDTRNIVRVRIPQLTRVPSAPRMKMPNGEHVAAIWFHRAEAVRLQRLFLEWEAAGLLDLILTFSGSYVPRFIRKKPGQKGKERVLSMHAYGLAFDINSAWNSWQHPPAPLAEEGTVIPLVEIAQKVGFYWGGYFQDGMHFEVADHGEPIAPSE